LAPVVVKFATKDLKLDAPGMATLILVPVIAPDAAGETMLKAVIALLDDRAGEEIGFLQLMTMERQINTSANLGINFIGAPAFSLTEISRKAGE